MKHNAGGAKGQKDVKSLKIPAQVFKWDRIERDNEAEGINWLIYREDIGLRLLYFVTTEFKPGTLIKKVWIIEDSAGQYHRAWLSLRDNQKRGIGRVGPFWPPHSPDLNMSEPLWNYIKSQLSSRYTIIGASEEAK